MLGVGLLLLTGCSPPAEEWVTRWSDEFDGAAGELLDASAWSYDIGNGENGWGNQQLEYDTDLASNVSMSGEGSLQIVARREAMEGFAYSSARVTTRDKVLFEEGRAEARIRLPFGAGLWPAFWMLGASYPEQPWPDCGEIDVMELNGAYPYEIHGTVHGPGYSGSGGVGSSFHHEAPVSEDFHVYAVEKSPEELSFWFDEELYLTLTPSDLPAGSDWVFDEPFFLILNLAVGGHYVGDPDANTVFPATMEVDYVRLSERQP